MGTVSSLNKSIFISYRVHDTAGEAGRLADSLKHYFHEDQIFMDIDKLDPGIPFAEAIASSLESCDIMLAVIGADWSGGFDAITNQAKIHKSDDWVKIEISKALERNIRVVPVLVNGASLPDSSQLPVELHALVKRQAYEISNKKWNYDIEQLVKFLIKFGIKPKRVTWSNFGRSKGKRLAKPILGILVAFALMLSFFLYRYFNKKLFYAKTSGIHPETVYRLIDTSEIIRRNPKDLKIMRNEIFARHGLIFKSPELREYFTNQDWYKPLYNDVSAVLTPIEAANAKLILSVEKSDTTQTK